MNAQYEIIEDKDVKISNPKKRLNIKAKICIGIVAIMVVIAIGIGSSIAFKGKTTKIGFEDIGELATQTAYCTRLNVIDSSRDIYGFKIPFTQSKYIYSYDIAIKAGFDFKDIEWTENRTSIEVKLPKARVLSSEINLDSFKVYHEQESIFNQVTIEENNDSIKEMKEKAEEDAISNGLLDNARANAETILKGFFANKYDFSKYTIVFAEK